MLRKIATESENEGGDFRDKLREYDAEEKGEKKNWTSIMRNERMRSAQQ